MSRLDLVIFGATGFTGKNTVIECARIAKRRPGLTWGIAGRSQSKLDAVLKEASKKTGDDLSSTPVILADVKDDSSVQAMCERAKVLVNCCGPYRLYGEPVVRAAVHCRTHYVDVSGEPTFIESMQLRYDPAAREAGVYIISACGFDSIPNDMGVIFLEQNFEGTLNSVESYISTYLPPEYRKAARSGVIHYGTWESIIYGVTYKNELSPLRKQLFAERIPTFQPVPPKRSLHKKDSSWCVPFPGSDASVVYRTQRQLYTTEGKRPVQFRVYVKMHSFLMLMLVAFAGVMFYLFTRTSFTRKWLLNYPKLFSFGMVTKDEIKEEVMDNTHFKMELRGLGWERGADVENTPPNKKMVAKVTGTNPGYGATVVALLYSALTILDEKDKMPKPGGVMTTGYAFRNTELIKRLHENNLKFEIIENHYNKMSRLDLVIFGATGFTGKNTLIECVRIDKRRPGLTWGIAGRSQSKLDGVLQEASIKTGENLSSIPVILADVSDDSSLLAMCKRAKVLVNCCGPYKLHGEAVVSAAVRCRTHYVDVSGEPVFIQSMQLRYDPAAREAGVYIISACGFDSIPNDMGVIFLERNFDGTLNSVESYISADVPQEYQKAARQYGCFHYGTWASIVYGLMYQNELPALRKLLYPDRMPTFKPSLPKRWVIHKHNGSWCVPFPFCDEYVVYDTQRRLYANTGKRPVKFHAYIKMPSGLLLLLTLLSGALLYLFTFTSYTRSWLLKYPRFFTFGAFTNDDIKEDVMDNTHFNVELHGVGWERGDDIESTPPTKKMVAKGRCVDNGVRVQ
ncbi:unnamed protein product [Parnassius apollo]|uniref:(apollo) hypothetical protein n=1 Tax=Parnassius apollo TaxID=110799 RepID=A0A8S3WYK3_PARAO|nr:unnamed protein product [Parnassius apollo]